MLGGKSRRATVMDTDLWRNLDEEVQRHATVEFT
jgi:hypothetical protein